ncbi:MAG: SDR family oxidoreductase [Deltaproteobacteria bacterium]|nr:SDR family oxidoreductase [Deltaproteobacteria bacterium]
MILITGGAGFIGSNIAEALLKKGESVRILDNFSTGTRKNLPGSSSRLEIMEGDIRDMDTCRRAARGVDYVLHHAALTSIPRSVEDPLLNNEINITGTLNMLVAARDAGVTRLIFASSCAVYGDTTAPGSRRHRKENNRPLTEKTKPSPLSPYAVSKVVGEEYCRLFSELYHLNTIALRYFNVFGPRQDPASEYAAVIPKFIATLLRRRQPTIYGDGNQTRDFIFIDDVVRANLLACTAENAAGKVFNVACGRRVNLHELLHELRKILKVNITPIHEEARPGDIRHSWADISHAEKFLGFVPVCSLHHGLSRTAKWLKK